MSATYADFVYETSSTTGTGTLDLDGAAAGFQSFVAGVGDGATVVYSIEDGTDWETGIGTVTDAATDTLSRDTILASSNAGAAVSFSAGTKNVRISPSARVHTFVDSGVFCGRLTLTSGTPITTSNVTAATTVYLTPHVGDLIALYTGAIWLYHRLSEISVSVPATTNTPFDIFVYDSSGTLTLETVNWTNDTTRATALATQDGVYVKTGDATRRYVGTCRTTGSSGQTEDSTGTRFLWNYYHRVTRHLLAKDTTDSWTYTTLTWRASNNTTTVGTSRVQFVLGVAEQPVVATALGLATSGSVHASTGIGIDSTSSNSAQYFGGGLVSGTFITQLSARYSGQPAAGYHYVQHLEQSQASGTTTWRGDNGNTVQQSGLMAEIMA